eukprot:584466-Rhodomonas_salina.2
MSGTEIGYAAIRSKHSMLLHTGKEVVPTLSCYEMAMRCPTARYTMSGTGTGCGCAMRMSGTDSIGYAATRERSSQEQVSSIFLRVPYAKSGTDLACGTCYHRGDTAISQRVLSAKSGTDLACGTCHHRAISLRVPYAKSGTELAYGAAIEQRKC